MGTLYKEPASIIQDLKVTLQHSSTIFPLEKTKRRSMFLSNIDQVLNFHVETVHFFPANPNFPPEAVAEKIKTALGKILVPYDFLAGRLKLDSQKGRMEIDCNAAGVEFAVAESEVSLQEIGDLVYPNPAFIQLIMVNPENFEPDNQPLCFAQVTSFKCGGFSMGLSTNHVTFDGISFKHFLENLASLAADKPLAITPCNDRQLLEARSPPCVMFPHPELVEFNMPPSGGSSHHPATLFEAKPDDLDFKIFRFSSKDILDLKEKAKLGLSNNSGTINTRSISSFNVVTAYVWRCRALSGDTEGHQEEASTLLYAVDIRSRLCPPLPPSYVGNGVLAAYACATIGEIEAASFSHLVEIVSEGATRMTDQYIRSAIDCGATSKRFPHGDLLISSWWKLGFSNVKYPWGKPKYSCPVVYHRKNNNIILFFPDIEEAGSDNGVNVLVALPCKEMEKFQTLFNKPPP